jgi:hypothetical protein
MRIAALSAALVWLLALPVLGGENIRGNARADADELVRNGLSYAARTLNDSGALSPFALVMASDGRISRMQPAVQRRMPSANELVDELEVALRDRATTEDLRAVAVFSDVIIKLPGGGESNAIHATWEHRSAMCADLYVPYMQEDSVPGTKKKQLVRGELRFGERIETPRQASMLQSCESVPAAEIPSSAATSPE